MPGHRHQRPGRRVPAHERRAALGGQRPAVIYIGDHDDPGYDFENNTRRVVVRETGEREWRRVALTPAQAADRERNLIAITKTDKRCRPPRSYQAVEVEALGQSVVTGIVRDALDSLLPEPLADVLERQRLEREEVRRRLNGSA